MISIGKVRSADYYLAEVGRDDSPGYYLDTERAGRWHGRLADDLGLSGRVDPDDFRAVLEGLHPDGPVRLRHRHAHPLADDCAGPKGLTSNRTGSSCGTTGGPRQPGESRSPSRERRRYRAGGRRDEGVGQWVLSSFQWFTWQWSSIMP